MTPELDLDLLAHHVVAGRVATSKHPTLDLHIYNYTNACVYEKCWDDVTRLARGLILDGAGNIVARPFEKFFNVGEHEADAALHAERFEVFKKMDGSLGIMYPGEDGWALATRGSFASEQARLGTEYLRDYTHHKWDPFTPRPGWTYLFEIIYPQNRIVVDYGETSDLCFLGAVNNQTGENRFEFGDGGSDWPGWRVERFDSQHLTPKQLTELERPNEEGFVLYFPESGTRMKAKLAEYVRVHRIISGTNTKRIWEWVAAGDDIEKHLERVPDEFYDFVRNTVISLREQYEAIEVRALTDLASIRAALAPDESKKTFALTIRDHPLKAVLFRLFDGLPAEETIWRMLKPERGEYAPSQRCGSSDG